MLQFSQMNIFVFVIYDKKIYKIVILCSFNVDKRALVEYNIKYFL